MGDIRGSVDDKQEDFESLREQEKNQCSASLTSFDFPQTRQIRVSRVLIRLQMLITVNNRTASEECDVIFTFLSRGTRTSQNYSL